MLGCKGLIPAVTSYSGPHKEKKIGFKQAINKEEKEQNVTLMTIGFQTLICNETLLTFQLLRFDC